MFRGRSLPVLCFSKTTRIRTVLRTMIIPPIFPVSVPYFIFKKKIRFPYHFRTQKYTFTRIPYSLRTRTWVRSTVRVRGVWYEPRII